MSADKRDSILNEARDCQTALAALRDELRHTAQSMENEYVSPSLPGDGRGEVSDALLAALAVSRPPNTPQVAATKAGSRRCIDCSGKKARWQSICSRMDLLFAEWIGSSCQLSAQLSYKSGGAASFPSIQR